MSFTCGGCGEEVESGPGTGPAHDRVCRYGAPKQQGLIEAVKQERAACVTYLRRFPENVGCLRAAADIESGGHLSGCLPVQAEVEQTSEPARPQWIAPHSIRRKTVYKVLAMDGYTVRLRGLQENGLELEMVVYGSQHAGLQLGDLVEMSEILDDDGRITWELQQLVDGGVAK